MKSMIIRALVCAFSTCALAATYTNSFVRDGATYVQRGGLTLKDYVITNLTSGGGGGGGGLATNGPNGASIAWREDGVLALNLPSGPSFSVYSEGDQLLSVGVGGVYVNSGIISFVGPSYGFTFNNSPVETADSIQAYDYIDTLSVVQMIQDATNNISGGVTSNEVVSIFDERFNATLPSYLSTWASEATVAAATTASRAEYSLGLATEGDGEMRTAATIFTQLDSITNALEKSNVGGTVEWNAATLNINGGALRVGHDWIYAQTQTFTWNGDAVATEPFVTDTIAAADTAYAMTNAIVSLNQSIQFATVANGGTLTILAPSGTGAKDWIVYAQAESATNTLALPSGTWYMADEAFTNSLEQGMNAIYISSVPTAPNAFIIGRQKLTAVTVE